MATRSVFVAFLATMALAPAAHAHATRSVTIDVSEVAPGKAAVHVRSSAAEDAFRIRAIFSAPCTATPVEEDGGTVATISCPGSLGGNRITAEGLDPIVSEAILVVSLRDGKQLSRVLTAAEPSFVVPVAQGAVAVARNYVRLGIVHIVTGYDHLLFLLALVLLLRRLRAVIIAETAFTISHSLTFSATALGLVHVSGPAAEAAIALSLVLIALDIGRAPGTGATSTRQAAFMAFAFGLVHGLGFAAGLRDVGLPGLHVSFALAGFAAGVETGQVAFLLAALVTLAFATRRLTPSRVDVGVQWASRLIGGVSAYWLIERTVAILASRV